MLRHVLPLGRSMYPSGQTQRYVPTSLEQNPTPHTSGFSLHSSMSKIGTQKGKSSINYTSAHGARSACASYVTITECTGVVKTVTFVAWAHVTPERVGAVAVRAQVVMLLALIDVFEYHLFIVGATIHNNQLQLRYPKYVNIILL